MDAMMAVAACALTLSPAQNRLPCESAPVPLRLMGSPIAVIPRGDLPSEFDGNAASNAGFLIDRWEPFIAEAAQRFAVPQRWIRAVMRSESGGRTMLSGRPITSIAGAMGLMQLMPGTYADMRQRYGLREEAPNVEAGTSPCRGASRPSLSQRHDG